MESNAPFYLVFTDLDGTLLDHDTYDWRPAIPALDLCRVKEVPVILVSSKTRAEMDVLRRRLSLAGPFIAENGGGIFFPMEAFPDPPDGAVFSDEPATPEGSPRWSEPGGKAGLWKISLGVPYAGLVSALEDIRHELNWDIRGFSKMGLEEIARLTGLDREEARWSALREYDEPFIIQGEPKDLGPLYRAAEQRGLLITAGGRFYHLQGKNDKAMAMERVAAWYRARRERVTVIALGDSPNDFAMLERADIPVLIRSRRTFPDLKRRIPGLIVSDRPGPAGWNLVIQQILTQYGEGVHERSL